MTRGHPVIMGRKTFESIGRPLSGRTNIVLTRVKGYTALGCIIVHDLKLALVACNGAEEAFICGGEEIYREAIPLADRIYLTVIHRPIEGDAYFPEVPPCFREEEREEIYDIMPYALIRYQRIGRQDCTESR